MKYKKIYIPESVSSSVGLKEINLTSKELGNTIALVGKNGAGKSRLLKLIENHFDHLTTDDIINDNIGNIPQIIIQKNEQLISNVRKEYKKYSSSNFDKQKKEQLLQQLKAQLNPILLSLKRIALPHFNASKISFLPLVSFASSN